MNSITERDYVKRCRTWLHRRHPRAFGYEPHWKRHESILLEKEIRAAFDEPAGSIQRRTMASGEPVTIQ